MNKMTLLEQAQNNLIKMGLDVRRRLDELAEARRTYGLDASHEALWWHENEMLRRVEAAQRKMEEGRYDRCSHCHRPINPERLLLVPYADSCMSCNVKFARRQVRHS